VIQPAPRRDTWTDAATVRVLVEARERYATEVSPHYDEALTDVAKRVDRHRSLGKLDLGGLLLWKRLGDYRRWAGRLNGMPDREIRSLTGEAVAAARDAALPTPDAAVRARDALRRLPGCVRGSGAWPSAILLAAAPRRMAVYDRRAHDGLAQLGYQVGDWIPYGSYMATVESLRALVVQAGRDWLARDVDVALYRLGGTAQK
jgi:hypothetical protein